jgi:type IX secretion system PorP/SprF family membrane protein
MRFVQYFIAIFLCILTSFAQAQEPQYSQFYVAPMYLNPAFAGNTEGIRGALIYRNQWPSIPGTFQSFSASVDVNAEDINSGIGAFVHRDVAGSGGLSFTSVGMAYSYTIRFNRFLAFRPALGMAYAQRGIDPSKLKFGDQLISGGILGVQTNLVAENVNYMDVSAGGLFFGDRFFLGYGAFHINRPNESLLEEDELSSIRHDVHGGYKFPLRLDNRGEVKTSLTLTAHYKSQREWDQFDLGAYFTYSPFMAGLWYRGIPGAKSLNGNPNNEAFVLLLGVSLDSWRFAYSYDITLSQLWGNTGGAHEISLIYERARNKRKRRRFRAVPCPSF